MKKPTTKISHALKISFLISLPILLFVLMQWVWWFHDPRHDGLDKEMRQLSGWLAVDCGRVPINGNPSDANACVQSAFLAHKPFIVRYDEQGFDSEVAHGIAATPQRQFYFLDYQSDASGGSKTGERISKRLCTPSNEEFFVCK